MPDKTRDHGKLEVICPDCRGSRGYYEMGRFCRCSECNGAGFVPTKKGKAILDLMRHNFRPMLDQNISER
jgi:DnaJ-class molecular chaperone